MTDSHLRDLERRFRTSGSVDDEAAWVRARVQAGEVSEGHLRLAAYMGHEAAALTLGPESPERPEALDKWLRRLSVHWDQEACVRAALAATSVTPAAFRASPYLEEAVTLAERWVLDPAEARRAVPALSRRFGDERSVGVRLDLGGRPFGEAKLAWVAGIHIHRTLTHPAGWGNPASTVAGSLQMRWPDLPIRAAIAREVAEWALRNSDPVRERIDARQRSGA